MGGTGSPTLVAGLALKCKFDSCVPISDVSRTMPVTPRQKTTGHIALISDEALQSLQSPEAGAMLSIIHGADEVGEEATVEMPCVGRPTTKVSTIRAVNIRRNKNLFIGQFSSIGQPSHQEPL